jgi:FkbM family methyltransferase
MKAQRPPLPPLPRIALSPRQWGTFLSHGFKAAAQQHHQELAPLFRRLVPADAVIFDVGAHAGQFAKLFARLAPQGTVYSFEPGFYARAILMLSLALNRVTNVTVFPLALGSAAGVTQLRMPIKASGSYGFGLSHLGTAERDGRAAHVESVDVVTLDAFCAFLSLARLDLIKADIEGWELQMLRGAAATLRRFRPLLWLEIVDAQLARAGDSRNALWTFLSQEHYRPHRVTAQGDITRLEAAGDGDVLWVPEEKEAALALGR